MRGLALLLAFGALSLASAPAAADAGSFVLVNGTDRNLSELAIRSFGGQDWTPLGLAPAAGARGPVEFSNPDCAFDIRGTLAGGQTVVWSGVNLCEAKIVTLKRDEKSRSLWVEYD
jgi:hypothetical protein